MLTKKLLTLSLAFMFAMAGMMIVNSSTEYEIIPNVSAGDTPYENMTEQINGLVPSFFLLMFVMVFMIVLLMMVDRVKK